MFLKSSPQHLLLVTINSSSNLPLHMTVIINLNLSFCYTATPPNWCKAPLTCVLQAWTSMRISLGLGRRRDWKDVSKAKLWRVSPGTSLCSRYWKGKQPIRTLTFSRTASGYILLILFIHTFLIFSFRVNFFTVRPYVLPAAAAMEIITI